MLRIPARAHSRILPLLLKSRPIELLVQIRIVKFIISMMYNRNTTIVSLIRRCMTQAVSNTGHNVSLVLKDFDIESMAAVYDKQSLLKVLTNKYVNNMLQMYSVGEVADANMCYELLNVRDGITSMDSFELSDCHELIAFLCTC